MRQKTREYLAAAATMLLTFCLVLVFMLALGDLASGPAAHPGYSSTAPSYNLHQPATNHEHRAQASGAARGLLTGGGR